MDRDQEVFEASLRINATLRRIAGELTLAVDNMLNGERRTNTMDGKIYSTENGGGVIEGSGHRRHTGKIVYRGARNQNGQGGQIVTRNAQILRPFDSRQLINYSPDGFNWGYGGSGPAQLALALLLDATGNPGIALTQHQNFKRCFVADFGDEWEISQEDIIAWLNSLDKDQGSELERAIKSYRTGGV